MDSSSWNRSMESPPSPTSLRSIPSHDPIRLGQGASSSTHRAIPDGLNGISSLSIHLNSSTAPLPSPPTSAPISTLKPIPPTPNASRAILAQTPSTGARLAHSPLGDGSIGDHVQDMRSRAVNIANVAVGQSTMCSPPTPAPSPTPRGTWTGYPRGGTLHQHVSEDEESMDHPELLDHLRGSLGRPVDIGKGKGRAVPVPSEVLDSFKELSKQERFAFLSALVKELQLNEALVVSRNIEPRLRRDFMRELPLELALHALSFVDDVKTLARASRVSRFWNSLLEDEQTWKEMCDKHHFRAIVSPIAYPRPGNPVRLDSFTGNTGNKKKQSARPAWASTDGRIMPSISDLIEQEYSGGSRTRPSEIKNDSGAGVKRSDSASFKQQFKNAYQTESNWLHGGHVLACHTSQDDGIVTSLAIDENFIVIGMANANIHIFDANSGAFRRSLTGHAQGVWALVLVTPTARAAASAGKTSRQDTAHPSRSGEGLASHLRSSKTRGNHRDDGQGRRSSFNIGSAGSSSFGATGPPTQEAESSEIGRPSTAIGLGASLPDHSSMPGSYGAIGDPPSSRDMGRSPPLGSARTGKKLVQSDICGSARGWGNKRHLVVSGGCDRKVRVWDIATGENIHSLAGHSSTIRCLKVLDGRPIAVSGSRDWTLRVWNIETGNLVHTLAGHTASVRCMEIAGNQVVSGSYDYTCRLWDADTGECLQVLRGHYHQIYAVAFDGEKIVTGSLDSTVRVWSAATGECLSLLQGHTSLVGQLQLSNNHLVTGGSDGRVIVFDLESGDGLGECKHRLCAHDNSVTCVQFDDRFVISGGNDGRVKLWDLRTGKFIRELTRPCDAVWRVSFKDDKCVILLRRGGKTVLEVLSFKPLNGSISPDQRSKARRPHRVV